ncbi:MAG TPA: FtsX-like permease family protein, partial [Pyrinomonadaceae bacterium]|nr:FtsX-like permease family protein [Pyrinomonadaceae bacterium]
RIRKQDEDYWDQYRTTPKAFIPLSTGQELWRSRFGNLTSLRLIPTGMPLPQALDNYQQQLKSTIDPAHMGLNVIPARQQGLEASRGATNFGEYFLYFSFFLVISALLLTALFFKLGVEQRLREIGLLQAIGYPASRVRKLFLLEGIVISIVGSVIGLAGALAYGQLMMTGLSTWWVEAVGTTMLKLHVAPLSLLLGAVGGVVAALVCIVWTLRRLGRESTRSLLTGSLTRDAGTPRRGDGEKRRRGETETHGHLDGSTTSPRLPVSPSPSLPVSPSPRRRVSLSPRLLIAFVLTLLGLVLLLLTSFQIIGQTAGFFGGGLLLLAAVLYYQSAWLRRNRGKEIHGTGWWPVSQLGFRNATYHPGRSVLCIALIASAAFIIVSVDAFRRREGAPTLDRKSGSGGFPLLAESLLPLVHDPNTREGREALNLAASDSASSLSSVTFTRFRVRPGDDASCLNLYQPRNPRIIAPTADFIQSGRFEFQNSLAESDEEKDNQWLLLNRESPDGAIPVIADANSLTYVLHLKLGEEFVLHR